MPVPRVRATARIRSRLPLLLALAAGAGVLAAACRWPALAGPVEAAAAVAGLVLVVAGARSR